MLQALHTQINWLDRSEMVELLEGVGIYCSDSESTDEIKEALVENIEDGTLEI